MHKQKITQLSGVPQASHVDEHRFDHCCQKTATGMSREELQEYGHEGAHKLRKPMKY